MCLGCTRYVTTSSKKERHKKNCIFASTTILSQWPLPSCKHSDTLSTHSCASTILRCLNGCCARFCRVLALIRIFYDNSSLPVLKKRRNKNNLHVTLLFESKTKEYLVHGFNEQARYEYQNYLWRNHSEDTAFLRLQKRARRNNRSANSTIDIIVVNLAFSRTGLLRESRPCTRCYTRMKKNKHVGVRLIYWFDRNLGFTYASKLKQTKLSTLDAYWSQQKQTRKRAVTKQRNQYI